MQVFKAFLKVLRKNLAPTMIYLGIFLGIAIPMSKVGAAEDSFKAKRMDVCIFDEDNTPESQALIDYIGGLHDIVDLENDRDTVMDALYYETVDYVLTIKPGYGESLQSGEDTEPKLESSHMHDSYSTVYMSQQLSEYVSTVKAYMNTEPDKETAFVKAGQTLAEKVEVQLPEKKEDREDYPASFAAYFQYMPYILISIFMTALMNVLRALNDKEIRNRTNCSSISIKSYTAQLFLGCGSFVGAVWLLLAVVGAMLHGGMYTGNALIALGNSVLFTLIAALMAIFISSLGPDIMLQNLLNQILGLGMSFLCGIFIPQSMLAESVLNFARVLPAYWYIRANNILYGAETYDAGTLGLCFGVQGGFIVALAVGTVIVNSVKRGNN